MVLLVDESGALAFLAHRLSRAHATTDAREALHIARMWKPSLVVVRSGQRICGMKVASMMKVLSPKTEVIVLGAPTPGELARARELDVLAYLPPRKIEVLGDLIEDWLLGSGIQTEEEVH